MFFINPETGVYEFVPSNIKHTHEWCKVNVRYEMAEYFGYRVYSLICENRHGGVNEHGVPEDKLEIMRKRFEIKL
jgi:hypothetical protein